MESSDPGSEVALAASPRGSTVSREGGVIPTPGIGNALLVFAAGVLLVSLTTLIVLAVVDPSSRSGVSGDDNSEDGSGGGGITVGPGPDEDETRCESFLDCPGPDRPYDFCAMHFQCRELTKVCSKSVLVDPCGLIATGKTGGTCDEASRTCVPGGNEPIVAEFPVLDISPPAPYSQPLSRAWTVDQSGSTFNGTAMLEFNADPGMNYWEYTFNGTLIPDVTKLSLVMNYRHSSSVPSDALGQWYAFDWTLGYYTAWLTSTDSWYGATSWYMREVPFPETGDWVDPLTGTIKVQFQWNNEKAHRYDYLALRLESCVGCEAKCDVTGCGTHERCDLYTGNCVCAPGWEGDDCMDRRVPTGLTDNMEVYEQDDSLAVYPITFRVMEDPSLPGYDYTWADVLGDSSRTDDFKPIVPCRFEVGASNTTTGDTFGQDWPANLPNGAVKLRGEFSRTTPYPGMKVELMDEWIEAVDPDAPTRWKTFNRINMLTSNADPVHIRASSIYRALRGFPHLTSWRTWFGALTIIYPNGDVYPWGPVTIVEDARDRAMEEHGLSADADSDNHCLYKLRGFRWQLLGGTSDSDPYAVDAEEWERRLDPKSCTEASHHKLIAAMKDFNDWSIPIEDLVAEYVYLPNAMSWLALNMLALDTDHIGKNGYLLTVPDKGSTVYWLPWDYDDILVTYGTKTYRFGTSLTQYTTRYFNTYFWRLLRSYPPAITELIAQAEALHATHLSEAHLTEIMRSAAEAIYPTYAADPYQAPYNKIAYDWDVGLILGRVNSTYESVMEQLDSPVGPKELEVEDLGGGNWGFEWSEGFSPHNRTVYYDLIVSTDPTFASWVHRDTSVTNVTPSWVDAPPADLVLPYTVFLPPGNYYARLEIVDSTGRRAQSGRPVDCGGERAGDVCFTSV